MKIHLLENRAGSGYLTFGGFWGKKEASAGSFLLRDESGKAIPVQSEILARWPDGSVKWSAHTVRADFLKNTAELLPDQNPETSGKEGIRITETEERYLVDNGFLTLVIPKCGEVLAEQISCQDGCRIRRILPVFQTEYREESGSEEISRVKSSFGKITSVCLEEKGPLEAVFCFRGEHTPEGPAKMPFVIRMYVWKGSPEIRFVHTFLFDGKEERDFLKGMGIRFDTVLDGPVYNHQIRYDDCLFHEAAVHLQRCWNPKVGPEMLADELNGKLTAQNRTEEQEELIRSTVDDVAVWDEYHLLQDSAFHWKIMKRTGRKFCWLTCREGKRTDGIMEILGENRGISIGIRDFWQKYPGGLSVNGLSKETAECTAWFYSPLSQAFDFRHYTDRSFPLSSYEGFRDPGPSAYGIGVTSECRICLTGGLTGKPDREGFRSRVTKPAAAFADPSYYHEKRAFGYWSLPDYSSPEKVRLEKQMEKAFSFYEKEKECRSWYGLFDYGDIMHTYDAVRHTWKYDVGGFAWQNTELVPTYWLWLYFLRTGREDVFTAAEAMSRHSSEVDTYHFGPYQGLGSRHNVRHWGCSCKEPRVAMAGHHRFLFYLTGDRRIGDVLEDVRDADEAHCRNRYCLEKDADGNDHVNVRSGPDWSSFVSNWMTHYERTLDARYLEKIRNGMKDLASTPFGLASGPDFYYDLPTAHLIYHGESEDTPNQHLQICMGGPQIWLELSDMLDDDTMNRLLTRLGSFYFLPQEEKIRLTGGKITRRKFSCREFACAVTGYAAQKTNDRKLAEETWTVLLENLKHFAGEKGFCPGSYGPEERKELTQELPNVSTNCAGQWCLNTIMCLEFIPEAVTEELMDAVSCRF